MNVLTSIMVVMETTKGTRRLVLVDVENFVGSPEPEVGWVQVAQGELERLLELTDRDMVVLACSHHAARTVSFSWRGGRRLWRSGPDGADLALLDVLAQEPVIGRFANVTVVSGDGIFATALSSLARSGVATCVVSTAGHLSRRSGLAALNTVLLEPWPWTIDDREVA